MYYLLILLGAVGLATAESGFCQSDVFVACSEDKIENLPQCGARFGKIDILESDLRGFINKHVRHSFEYLLMSSHFKNHEKNREGFTKLFKNLSDKTWNAAIDLVKYLTKRGGILYFGNAEDQLMMENTVETQEQYETHELEGLAKALDIQKSLADEANKIHLVASEDSETTSHIENKFVHQLSKSIRMLSGHVNDLKNLMAVSEHNSLHIHLFDEYLRKLY